MSKIDKQSAENIGLAVNKKYLKEKQELDKFLERLITPYIKGKRLKILDLGCGIGHIINLLNQISPQSEFLGIDIRSYLIKEAKKLIGQSENIQFKTMDAYHLSQKYQKEFDICISWKTLSWLKYYEKMLKEMAKVTRKHIFISSLFYEGNIDFEIKVKQYFNKQKPLESYYNVYSLHKFKRVCLSLGIKRIKVYDFEIAIDLPRPPINEMGTYTVKTQDGKRLQISGAVIMLWKVIRINI